MSGEERRLKGRAPRRPANQSECGKRERYCSDSCYGQQASVPDFPDVHTSTGEDMSNERFTRFSRLCLFCWSPLDLHRRRAEQRRMDATCCGER